MRLNFLLFAFSCALTSAKIGEDKTYSLKDYGLLHTEAFNKLSELHATKTPSSEEGMVKDLTDIVAGLCDGDSKCEERTKEKIGENYKQQKSGNSHSLQLPDEFDEDVLDSLSSMFSVINTVTTKESIDDVLSSLDDIEKEIVENDSSNEGDKSLAIAGLSIAKESAKLWHEVYSDESHSLHGLHFPQYYQDKKEEGDRKLQLWNWGDYYGGSGGGNGAAFTLPEFNITFAVLGDINVFIASYADAIAQDPTVIIPINVNFLTVLSDALAPAIAQSSYIANQADSFGREDGGDEDEGDEEDEGR